MSLDAFLFSEGGSTFPEMLFILEEHSSAVLGRKDEKEVIKYPWHVLVTKNVNILWEEVLENRSRSNAAECMWILPSVAMWGISALSGTREWVLEWLGAFMLMQEQSVRMKTSPQL